MSALLLAEVLVGGVDGNDLLAALLGFRQVARQALVVALVDNRGVFRVVENGGIHAGYRILRGVDHFVQLFLRYQQVVRGQADLACIQRLADHYPAHALGDIRAAGDNYRRLAPQFQGDRHQVAGGCCHDVPGDRGGPGEDHVVEGQPGEGLAHLGATGEHGDLIGIVGFSDHLGQYFGSGRGKLRRLDHGPVTGRQYPCQGAENHVDRKVPGRDHADHAEWLVLDARAASQQVQGKDGRSLLCFHPLAQVLLRVLHGGDAGADIGQQRHFPAATAEVAVQGFDQPRLVLDLDIDSAVQSVDAGLGTDHTLFQVV